MKCPVYPQYKDSGVQWLGEVPEHWEVKKLGYTTSKIGSGKTPTGGATTYLDEGVMFLRSQNIYDDGLRLEDVVYIEETVDEEMENSRVQPLDIMLNITGASLGRTCIVPDPFPRANVNQHVCIIRQGNKERSAFIAWMLKSAGIKAQVENAQTGAAREGLNFVQISKLLISLPPLSEQTAIAEFLDRETGRIDTLMAKKRRLIALLGEKRTALISRTVTRGLPADATREFGLEPHTRFKDSSIEWLGEVPESWEIVPLRHLILALDQGWSPTADSSPATEDQWGVLKLSAIREGSFAPSDNKTLDDLPNGINPLTPNDGDVLISRANTPERVGDACLVKGEHPWRIIPDLIYRLQLDRKKVLPVFVVAFLLSRGGRAQIQADARGSNGSMVKLGQSHLRSWLFPLPPLPEQAAIATYLDRETATIDQLVAKVEAAIARLLEYRTALITAAVTGKIDVRGHRHSRACGSPEEVL